MVRLYKAQFSLKNCPIVLVYSTVAAASALLLTIGLPNTTTELDQRLRFLFKSLDECSETLGFAGEARRKFQKRLDKAPSNVGGGKSSPTEPVPRDEQDLTHDQLQASSPWMDFVFGISSDTENLTSYEPNGTSFGYGMLPLASPFDTSQFFADEQLQGYDQG
jgi:hypothetical protein